MLAVIIPGVVAAIALTFSILRACIVGKNPSAGPHTMPHIIPVVKSTFSFVFDGPNFFRQASCFCQGQWPLRVNLLEDEIYLVQGQKNILAVFSNPGLTVTRAYGVVLKYCFGMKQKAVDVYVSDTSGSRQRPIAGSKTPPNCRVSYHTHENLIQGLLGSGLGPTTERFDAALYASLDKAVPISHSWTYKEDFTQFFEDHLGTAMLETLYGPLLLAANPDFNRKLWQYDKHIMALAKRLPAWMIPGAYRLRDELLRAIMKWHRQATELTTETTKQTNSNQGDADPHWGSAMMRERNKMLLKIDRQDPQSVASTDLGFIWASITNVVPSTMTLCTHMYSDSSLVDELRSALRPCIKPGTGSLQLDMDKISKQPLLLSMYAETLRFGVQIHIPRCSPHQSLSLGDETIPSNKLIIINTALAHTDEEVWNTKDGQYPLDTFWARRFLIDSADPRSGPLKPSLPLSKSAKERQQTDSDTSREEFTVQGLEGIWIPYGGGQHACPGRLLAKRTMLLTSAMMVTMFDVELLTPASALCFQSSRFGFGVRKPGSSVPFRIRRRC
ncbi:cytochrome P450 [Aspergillus sclerotioniger CBS 115572]|uniref:Cytochrome P450 n=1 Tax=Aspergillus sclerotioniger CBS 115572 TaxID=1450535 RepID=A0A317WQA1_9EURO|nr:cytochrome P450 [Aspergillus sclerotioniger CBS 115572]PWY88576.1 cytochrome P450 [Aspergillus sclerotioniger CBS 115572]